MAEYPIISNMQLLSGIPLKPTEENSIRFASATERDNYFQTKVWRVESDVQYIRENNDYRCNLNRDDVLMNCNYLRFMNESSGKWFYAYLTNVRYINPNVCGISFQIDSFMTYQYDITWGDCFIEREHVADDTIGAHTIDENVYIGDNLLREIDYTLPFHEYGNFNLLPICLVSEPYLEDGTVAENYIGIPINGTAQTLAIWVPNTIEALQNTANWANALSTCSQSLYYFFKGMSAQTKQDAIALCYMVPMISVNTTFDYIKFSTDEGPLGGYYIQASDTILPWVSSPTTTQQISFPDDIGSYEPKNNKLFTYPYMYYVADNNQGKQLELRREWMGNLIDDNNNVAISFQFRGNMTPDTTLYMMPNAGYNVAGKRAYTLSISKFPKVPTVTDTYAAWLNGHEASLSASYTSGITTGIIGGIASGNPSTAFSSALGGANQILSTMATEMDKAKLPDTVNNSLTNTSNNAAEKMTFSFYRSVLKPEIYEMIDNYFTMFGYKVNRMGKPKFRSRQYYNYYKIPYANIYGNIPGDDIENIRGLFTRGITLWNTTDVGNYRDGDNPIVGGA